jgi:opacity protein-like surface antigen
MKKIFLFTSIIVVFALNSANAQSYTNVSYSIGLPTGDLSDYISAASWRGVALDYRRLIKPNIGVGVSTGWNTFFEEREFATYTLENRSISGDQWRYVNSFPLFLSADYYLKPGEDINPYVGLGVGTIYNNRATDMGIFRLEQEAWSFAFQPQVGMFYSINHFAGISIAAKYSYGLAAGDFESAQSFFSLNIGYVFMGN